MPATNPAPVPATDPAPVPAAHPAPLAAEDIDALVFDIGGVFVVPHHELVGEHLRRAGYPVPRGEEPYHRAHHRGVRALSALTDHDEQHPSFWRDYHRAYVRSLGVDETVLEDARRALGLLFGSGLPLWSQRLTANIAALRRLADSGRPMAIVSNNDGTAEAQMLEFEVCQIGAGPLPDVCIVVDSAVVGVAKPNPAIFTPALEALGTDPARTLYVGDTVHADVRGARAAGMAVVQLDPFDDHHDFDHHRLRDLHGLADLLGA